MVFGISSTFMALFEDDAELFWCLLFRCFLDSTDVNTLFTSSFIAWLTEWKFSTEGSVIESVLDWYVMFLLIPESFYESVLVEVSFCSPLVRYFIRYRYWFVLMKLTRDRREKIKNKKKKRRRRKTRFCQVKGSNFREVSFSYQSI